MRSRDRTALALAPLFLRLSLAVTFLWAGLGKFMARMEVEGEEAAILANYGVIPNPAPGRTAPADPTLPDPPEDDGQASLTPLRAPSASSGTPRSLALRAPGASSGTLSVRAPSASSGLLLASFQADDAANQPEDAQDQPQDQPEDQPTDQPEPPAEDEQAPDQPADTPPSQTQRQLAAAADFPQPVSVRRYAGLVLMLHGAIHPGLNPDDSSPRMRLWPDFDPSRDFDPWPVRFSWAVALTEVIGGALVAVGLLTRLGALGLAGVMLGAMWLTGIGPAIQSGAAKLGFLPNLPTFDPGWSDILFQFTVFCAAVALFFAGPGALSLDRLLVGGPPRPEPAKPAPAPAKK